MEESKTNREYKDRVFILLFGSEEYKDNALALYNALNGTDYSNADEITFYTISDAIYIRMKNDVAVLFDSRLSLWEHQSTYNPNMPIRGLMYFGSMYDRYIRTGGINIYGSRLVELPVPRYYVFYNGDKDLPSVQDLRLSSSFPEKDRTGDFEWTATMLNLNRGKNDALLEKCRALSEYMHFVDKVKTNTKADPNQRKAVDRAVKECISEGVLADFLLKHRSEVVDMVITEFDEETYRNGIFEEGYNQAKSESKQVIAEKDKHIAEKDKQITELEATIKALKRNQS